MLFSHCNWDVSEAPVWHVALRDRPRAHGEKRAKYCLSAWDKMTWVNSINTMINIPPNIHTSPQLPLCPCTRTHSLWEPVAGKLIGSICCLGGSIPSSNPLHPSPRASGDTSLAVGTKSDGGWMGQRARERQRYREQTCSWRSCQRGCGQTGWQAVPGRDAPKGQMVYRSGQDAMRERWDTDKCKKWLALKIKMQHLEFGSIINFTQIGQTI